MVLPSSRLLRHIAVAISGGVDSAVAALLLKSKGYDLQGVFMNNWDHQDETVTSICTEDADCATAAWLCKKLEIPFTEMNFVSDYWNDVFQYLLSSYSQGLTPNPDILCNRLIKFDALAKACQQRLGTEWLATGHYARLRGDGQGGVHLLRAVDESKDQTFFLSAVPQNALKRAIFPLGGLHKSYVRKLAVEAGLTRVAAKKESMGICFIGNRLFRDFISEYIPDSPGQYLDADTGRVMGEHRGVHRCTLGQRVSLQAVTRCYVAEKRSPDVLVVAGHHHPRLYSSSLYTAVPHWLRGVPPPQLLRGNGELECQFRFQHRAPLVRCVVRYDTDAAVNSSSSTADGSSDSVNGCGSDFSCNRLQSSGVDGSAGGSIADCGLVISLEKPLRVITPGQFSVLYLGQECLGSATILRPGPSLYELNTKGCRDMIQHLRRPLPSLLTADIATAVRRMVLQGEVACEECVNSEAGASLGDVVNEVKCKEMGLLMQLGEQRVCQEREALSKCKKMLSDSRDAYCAYVNTKQWGDNNIDCDENAIGTREESFNNVEYYSDCFLQNCNDKESVA